MIEQTLETLPESERSIALGGLLTVELRERWRRGERFDREQYLRRFEHFGTVVDAAWSNVDAASGTKSLDDASGSTSISANARPSEAADPSPMFGDYEILDEVARGGMGVVFRARQNRLGRVVALKMALAGRFADPEERKRFLVEAAAAAKLDHPHIAPVYDVGEYEGQPFYTMAFVDGQSLRDALRDGPFEARRAALLIAQVAAAVQYAHEQGVIHRDLKPGNVLVDSLGNPRIVDFGLAKRRQGDETLTGTGQILGTPGYMPPEQARGESEVGPAADIYGLGATLYHLLTGRAPFQAADPVETLRQVMHDDPVPPRRLNSAVPRDLETICLKSLEKQPSKRYSDACTLGDDLNRYLDGKTIAARRTGPGEKALRWAGRNRALASAIAVAVMILIGGTVASSTFAALMYRARVQEVEATKDAEDSAAKALLSAYRTTMLLASYTAREGNYPRLKELLDQQVPSDPSASDLRGWEWDYLSSLLRDAVTTLPGSGRYEGIVSMSGDGTRIAAATKEGAIDVWDVQTQRIVKTHPTFDEPILAMAWHPQEATLAVSPLSGGLYFLDAENGTETGRIEAPPNERRAIRRRAIAWTPNGDRVAMTIDEEIDIWDAETLEPIATIPRLEGTSPDCLVFALDWHPDGNRLAAGHRFGYWSVWDVDARSRSVKQFCGVGTTIKAIGWSADGERIALGGTVRDERLPELMLCHPDGRRIGSVELPGSNGVGALRWIEGDDRLLATCDDGHLRVLDAVELSVELDVHVFPGTPTHVVWDGESDVALAATDDGLNAVPVHDRPLRRSIVNLGADNIRRVAFAPDGSRLAANTEGSVLLLGGDERTSVILDSGLNPADASWSTRGDRLAIASSEPGRTRTRIYDLTTDDLIVELPPKGPCHSVGTTADIVEFNPRDDRIVVATFSEVLVYDLNADPQTKSPVTLPGIGKASAACWSPDGKKLAVRYATSSGQIGIWNTGEWETPYVTIADETTPGSGLAWSRDGSQLVLNGMNGRVTLIDVAVDPPSSRVRQAHSATATVCWAPDGSRIVTGGDDELLKIWDAQTFEELVAIDLGTQIECVAWSDDGSAIAAGCWDGTVRLLVASDASSTSKIALIVEAMKCRPPSVEDLEPVATLRETWSASWSPDGKSLALRTSDRSSNPELLVHSLASGERRTVVTAGSDPAWRPNSESSIAFMRRAAGGSVEIWWRRGADSEPEKLCDGYMPSWSSDGSRLFYTDLRTQTVRALNPDDPKTDPEILISSRAAQHPAVSPNGHLVALCDAGTLKVLDVDTESVVASCPVTGWNCVLAGWSPDNRYVGFGSNGLGDQRGLWVLNVESGAYRQVAVGNLTQPRWSFDGKYVTLDERNANTIYVVATESLALP